jgi:hypothetical protein
LTLWPSGTIWNMNKLYMSTLSDWYHLIMSHGWNIKLLCRSRDLLEERMGQHFATLRKHGSKSRLNPRWIFCLLFILLSLGASHISALPDRCLGQEKYQGNEWGSSKE